MKTSSAPTERGDALLTIPNILSILRLVLVPVFLWLFISGRENIAVIVYAVGAATDFLDGFIARRWGQVSEFGKLVDPLADRVLIIALTIALVVRGTLWVWLAVVVVVRDVVILSLWPALEHRGVERIRVNWTGKTATACLFFGLTSLALSETSFPGASVGDEVGVAFTIAGAVLYWTSAAMYSRRALTNLKELKAERVVE
jgi:cardiolipin synthase